MRERGEYEVGLIEGCVFGRDERDVPSSYARALPPLSVGRSKTKLKTGMTSDEREKLTPCVAAGTQDTDRKFMHK